MMSYIIRIQDSRRCLSLKISNMMIKHLGDGIARIQGFVVFVENGKVSNKVKVKVTEVADRFEKATLV